MEITVNPQIDSNKIINAFQIHIECYYGDADGDSSTTFLVPRDNILQVIAEIVLVENQFRGRGGCRAMYDQTNYFVQHWQTPEEELDGRWDWLDIESGFPYYSDGEQNYTIQDYKVTWFDSKGDPHVVTIAKLDGLIAAIKDLNTKHRLGDYDVWDDDCDDLKPLFAAYRKDAIELVDQFAANATLNMI